MDWRPRRRRWALFVALVVAHAVPVAPAGAADVEYRYTVATRGPVRFDAGDFAAEAAAIFADGRGWALDGRVRFTRVASGGDFTLWLAAAGAMGTFGAPCHRSYSCRSGRNVVINEDRWAGGSPPWHGPLAGYRRMVLNHETGHWLGLGHAGCGGAGQPAPVMMQQSKGTGACQPNPWPLPSEREWFARRVPPPQVRTVGIAATGDGCWLVASDGDVSAFGGAGDHGDAPTSRAVALAPTPSGGGYWVAGADGGVFALGDAAFSGSATGRGLAVVALAPTPAGAGYWLAGSGGEVVAFGDARFHGSPTGLATPVVGMAATPSGRGYWLVGADGGVFAYGDARFFGSGAGTAAAVGIAPTPSGAGYWLAAADGGVFAYGDARFFGSGAASAPVVGIAPTAAGGYHLVDADGVVRTFGGGS